MTTHFTVVLTHPGRGVGHPYVPTMAVNRWSGPHITRAFNEAMERSCPLLFIVTKRGMVEAGELVQHLGQRGRLSQDQMDKAAYWLVGHRVQQVLWFHDGLADHSLGADVKEIVRLAQLHGAIESVLPELVSYGPDEGARNALDSDG